MPNGPSADKKRHLALARALKFNILFNEPVYDRIMNELNKTTGADENTFKGIVEKYAPSLRPSEREWLWNYLKSCKETGTGGWHDVPDAATVGW